MKMMISLGLCMLALTAGGCHKKPTQPPPDDDNGEGYNWIDGAPSWSYDGSKIAYTHWDTTTGNYQLWIVDLATLNKRYLLEGTAIEGSGLPDWSPTGDWIVFGAGAGYSTDVYKIKANGDSLTRLTFTGCSYYPKWLPDGKRISYYQRATSTLQAGMYFIDSDGTNSRILTQSLKGYKRDWSPEFMLVYIYGSTELYISDSLGNNPILIFNNNGYNIEEVQWSPNGHEILFPRINVNIYDNYIINPDGTGLRRLTTDGSCAPNWSPDGSKIVYCKHNYKIDPYGDSTNGRLWIMDNDGSNRYQITFP